MVLKPDSSVLKLFQCIFCLLYATTCAKNRTYDFKVFPVSSCPKNKADFQKSSLERNCSTGRRYNCAPNGDLSSLIEFCTDRPKGLFQEGNCLRLEGKGALNHFKCGSFTFGCPSKPYYDDELYLYQACLQLNTKDACFLAEKNCSIGKDVLDNTDTRSKIKTTPKENGQIEITVVTVVISVLVFAVVCLILVFRHRRRKDVRNRNDAECEMEDDSDEQLKNYKMSEETQVYRVNGYVVGYSGSMRKNLLDSLKNIPFISFNSKDLRPSFPTLKKRYEGRCKQNRKTKRKEKKKSASSESIAPDEIAIKKENSNEQGQSKKEEYPLIEDGAKDSAITEDTVKDFENKSSKEFDDRSKTLILSDFSGNIGLFPFQQMCVQNDIFYIIAIDMSQPLEEAPSDTFSDCKWKTVKEYYSHWMDTILAFSKQEEHSFIFIAVNASNLSSKSQTEYFDELWKIYEDKSMIKVSDIDRRKREFTCRRHHLLKRSYKKDLCQCIVSSLERNKKWGISLPLCWGVAERFILKKRKRSRVITRDELFQYCSSMSECDFTDMLQYFHDVGLIGYFDKEPVRKYLIINVNSFFCAVGNMIDSNYFKNENCRVHEKFLKKGLLTLEQFNHIWMEEEETFVESRIYLQFLRILAILKETITHEETFYLPILCENQFDNLSERFRQSSILCFQFHVLPICLFHRLLVAFVETLNWTVRTDNSGRNLYKTAAIFKYKGHDILIGVNENVIEARVFIIDTLFIDKTVTSVVKQNIESTLKSLCERLYPKISFEIGYKCKVLAKFCDSDDSYFITEEKLRSSDNQECPICSKSNTHSVSADRILGHWKDIPIRSLSKDSMKDEDDGELTDEDNRIASRIRKACKDGNKDQFYHECQRKQVQKLLKRGFLHKHDQRGNTILHLAAEGGSFEIFKKLIDMDDKTDVFESTDVGQTVLHIACKHAQLPMCKHLLSHYPDLLNKKTKRKWNAIHFAALGGDVEIMNLLEQKGLNLNDTTIDGYSILHIATKENRYDMCKHILRNHSQLLTLKTDDGLVAAHYAAKRCNKNIFQLFENDTDISELTNGKRTFLHIACEKGDLTFCEYISQLSSHIFSNVDEEGWNALHFAAKSGCVEVAKNLIKNGIKGEDVTNDGKTILHIACTHNRYAMCCYITYTFPQLINKCNDRGWNAAHYVAVEPKQNDEDDEGRKIIDHLNSCGIDMLKVTASGSTVLTMAISHKNKKLALYLVEKYPELLYVASKKSIVDVAFESNDEDIKNVIKERLQQPLSYL